jgi:hypothetical protein
MRPATNTRRPLQSLLPKYLQELAADMIHPVGNLELQVFRKKPKRAVKVLGVYLNS